MPRKRNTDPGVYPYLTDSGKRWGAVVSLPIDPRTGKRGQKRKQGFLTKDDALTWKRSLLNDVADGIDPRRMSRVTVNVYLDNWLRDLADLAPETRRNYRNKLVAVREEIGHVQIGQVTTAMITRMTTVRIERGDAPASIRASFNVFKRALRRAHHSGVIPANPFTGLRAPREPKHEVTTWTLTDMQTFLGQHGDDVIWGDMWHVLCQTWMRVGEVTDLRWGDIDFAGSAINVTHAVARNDHLQLESGPTKTARSRRRIQIDDDLTQRLRKRKLRAITSDDEDLVFPPPRGVGFIKSAAVARALKRSCALAGVPELTTHELRHNGGSLAYMAGVDIATISERMGHASIAITWSVYTHLNEAHHKNAANQIGALLRGEFAKGVTDQESDGQKTA